MISVSTKTLYEENPDTGEPVRMRSHEDPALNRTLHMLDYARETINRKLPKYGVEPVGLPDFVAVEDMKPSYALLPLGNRLYVLPTGHVEGYYDPLSDTIAINLASIPGTEENKRFIDTYEKALGKVNKLISAYPTMKKPLHQLRSFYSRAICGLKEGKYDVVMVHEVLHKKGEELELNRALADVPATEAYNTAFTDEVCGKKTTEDGTGYRVLNNGAYVVMRRYGRETPLSLMGDFRSGRISGNELRTAYRQAARQAAWN